MKLTITNTQYKQLPERLQKLFIKMYNHSSEEVRECFPENVKGEIGRAGRKSGGNYEASSYKVGVVTETGFKDNGNASRFFKSILYYPKSSKAERNKGCKDLPLGEPPASARSKPAEGRENALGNPRANNHPTVKPIALMEYLIKMVTKEGGIVFDPFTGSGTTLVAAKKNGYQYLGTEMTDEYIPIIEARLNATEPKQEEIVDKGWFG